MANTPGGDRIATTADAGYQPSESGLGIYDAWFNDTKEPGQQQSVRELLDRAKFQRPESPSLPALGLVDLQQNTESRPAALHRPMDRQVVAERGTQSSPAFREGNSDKANNDLSIADRTPAQTERVQAQRAQAAESQAESGKKPEQRTASINEDLKGTPHERLQNILDGNSVSGQWLRDNGLLAKFQQDSHQHIKFDADGGRSFTLRTPDGYSWTALVPPDRPASQRVTGPDGKVMVAFYSNGQIQQSSEHARPQFSKTA